jgi:hypothetical protein
LPDRCELADDGDHPGASGIPSVPWDNDEALQTHLLNGGRVERLMLQTADKLPKDRVKA